MREPRTLRVADGEVHVYRLFDVADAVDLPAAERALAQPRARLKLEGHQTGAALEIPSPPLHVHLGARRLSVAAESFDALATARLFDHGVVSVRYRLPIPAGSSLEELLPLAEALVAEPTPALDQAARREADELVRALAPCLEKPHEWEGLETYTVFFVRRFEEPATADDVLRDAPLGRLVLGETSGVPLSDAEREDVLKNRYSYLEDDLAVVDWNCAFVLEPSGVTDIPDLLEFATAHLLELRYYDSLLDRELQGIYGEIDAKRTLFNVFTRRYLKLRRRTAALLLELSEMTERLENAVKIVGDFYLARLYQGAVRRFRLPVWQDTVLRKQKLLAGVHELLNDAADTRRAELLELTIILLILWEILYAFIR